MSVSHAPDLATAKYQALCQQANSLNNRRLLLLLLMLFSIPGFSVISLSLELPAILGTPILPFATAVLIALYSVEERQLKACYQQLGQSPHTTAFHYAHMLIYGLIAGSALFGIYSHANHFGISIFWYAHIASYVLFAAGMALFFFQQSRTTPEHSEEAQDELPAGAMPG